jgi:class 3 adenylate cyclase
VERLSAAGLAKEARVEPSRVEQLTQIGVLQPGPDGSFDRADVQRVEIADAYEASGIEIGLLAQAIAEDRMSFAFTDRIYPIPSPLAGLTVAGLEAELGEPGLVTRLYTAFGLAVPQPDRELRADDVTLIRGMVAAWRPSRDWPDPMYRAARLAGMGIRRAVEGWAALFAETIALPAAESADMTRAEYTPLVLEPGARLAQLMHPSMLWLADRNMERALNALNVETMEAALDARGLRRRAPTAPRVVVFADLAGYTQLTEEAGDELAARHAARLSTLAAQATAEHGGRLVKELGDGVLLVFPDVLSATRAVVALRMSARDEGLTALHVGISAGPIVERDGDVYGRTVNLAARLSAAAEAGDVLLTDAVAHELPDGVPAASLGKRVLKGIPAPIIVYRLAVDSPEPGP